MKKIMEEQRHLCVQIFNTDKVFYSGEKNATKDISKEEKRAPELRQEWKG